MAQQVAIPLNWPAKVVIFSESTKYFFGVRDKRLPRDVWRRGCRGSELVGEHEAEVHGVG